jgi:hypothetical protein
MYKLLHTKPMSTSLLLAILFLPILVLTACAASQGGMPGAAATGPGGGMPKEEDAPYKTTIIKMEMEAGADKYEPWPGGGNTIHTGIGWLHPFGRGEYYAGMGYPEAEAFPPPSYFNEEWMNTYATRLFCIYRLADGDIYAYDGVTANLEPTLSDGDDGKMDYLINVIVGGTGAYEGATGMLLGRTPGRGASTDVSEGVSLPVSILKLMEGYIKIPEK